MLKTFDDSEQNYEEYEEKHVHSVYEKIAFDFSNTRYKVWPSVKEFIKCMPNNSNVLEVGSGNGKNLNDMIHISNKTGCDMAQNFVDMVIKRGIPCYKANILDLPFESDTYDYTLCVAVLHHLSTESRRIRGIKELIRVTKPKGLIFIQVWAMEQPKESKRKFDTQDSLVSWDNSQDRYYHLFVEGELEKLVADMNVTVVKSFYEIGNWGIIISKNSVLSLT